MKTAVVYRYRSTAATTMSLDQSAIKFVAAGTEVLPRDRRYAIAAIRKPIRVNKRSTDESRTEFDNTGQIRRFRKLNRTLCEVDPRRHTAALGRMWIIQSLLRENRRSTRANELYKRVSISFKRLNRRRVRRLSSRLSVIV